MSIDHVLLERADRLQALTREQKRLIREGHVGRQGQKSDVYLAMLEEWWDAYNAFHAPLADLSAQMRRGEPDAIEQGIVYLESAPRCHRSGYLAERVLRILSRAPLSREQADRCQAVVVHLTTLRWARGWNDIGALAGSVWTANLARELSTLGAANPQALNDVRMLVRRVAEWRGSNGEAMPMDGLSEAARGAPTPPVGWRMSWRALLRSNKRRKPS